MGNVVDRDNRNIECFTLLLAYKIKYPDHIYIVRDNNDEWDSLQNYMYKMCGNEFAQIIFGYHLTETFNSIPYAATIDDLIL